MVFYDDKKNRFIFLIEQIRLSLLSGITLEGTVKYISPRFDEFQFLNDVSKKVNEGKTLDQAIEEQLQNEVSHTKKDFLNALKAGDFAAEKLAELREKILNGRKQDFEALSSSLMKKIGILAMITLIPVGVYFMTSISEILASVGLFDFQVTDNLKIGVILVCAIAFIIILYMKRLKNG